MSMAPVIGIVKDITKGFEFEWEIKYFLTLAINTGSYYSSPLFSFAGESWYLDIYPNGLSTLSSVGWISCYLKRNMSGPPVNVKASFGLRTNDGKMDNEVQFTRVFEKSNEGYGVHRLLQRALLLRRMAELLPSDTLTVICCIENCLKKHKDEKTETQECTQCKTSFDVKSASSSNENFSDKPIICPTCAATQSRKCVHHECEKARVKATEKLVEDLGDIFRNNEHSDVVIKVKDEELRLHRCILAGRNPYFSSMFKSEMKEKSTGIVTIEDCEPDIFRSFIRFVYTGKVDDLAVENVCDLYEVADKYQEDHLKEECLCLMNNNISIDNFCDFTVLALKYSERELLDNATKLFCSKTKDIIKSVKWQTFMQEYPTEANELHIKALECFGK